MPAVTNFQAVFSRLKEILADAQGQAVVTADQEGSFSLNTPYSSLYHKEIYLGGVEVKKNYVSFHLMPVYMYPDLLEDISPALRRRMQGKSCFNFTCIDEQLFGELETLTRRSLERMRAEEVF
jgi:hypothetical protein